jgi:hypothetical protein
MGNGEGVNGQRDSFKFRKQDRALLPPPPIPAFSLGRNDAVEKRSAPAPGTEPRPRGSHERSKPEHPLVTATPRVFARRTELWLANILESLRDGKSFLQSTEAAALPKRPTASFRLGKRIPRTNSRIEPVNHTQIHVFAAVIGLGFWIAQARRPCH